MTHQVALVGGQVMPIVLLVLESTLRDAGGVDSLTLLHTSETEPEAKQVKAALLHSAVAEIPIALKRVEAYNPASVAEQVGCVRSSLPDGASLVVNLTGGTKLMSLGAFQAATDLGAERWTYLAMETGRVFESDKSPPVRELDRKVFDLVDVDTFVAAQGLEVTTVEAPLEPLHAKEATAVAQALATNWNVKPDLAEFKNVLMSTPGGREVNQPTPKAWDLLNSFGWLELQHRGTRVWARPTQACPWIHKPGLWLEEYVADQARLVQGVRDVRLSMEQAGAEPGNERDVVFVYHGRLVLIECKTGHVTGNDVLELETLRRSWGGTYARAGLVLAARTKSSMQNRNSVATRAKSLDMFCLVKEDLADLKTELAAFLEAEFPQP